MELLSEYDEGDYLMKIVFPDAGTMGSDIDLSAFAEYGSLTVYEESSPDEAADRIREADVLL